MTILKGILIIFLVGVISFGISVWVMYAGWGLEVKNWWVVGGGYGILFTWQVIGKALEKA